MTTKTKTEKKSIAPLGERVLVREIPAEERTAAGIILPPSAARHRVRTATVLEIGTPGKPEGVRVNDVVMIADFAGVEVTLDNEKFLIVLASEIIAKIRGA
jgi:chaperonin GroES